MNVSACEFPEELLETYAMGKLSGQESEPVEEHLLLCPICQQRLDGLDDFIHVIKAALAAAGSPPDTLAARRVIQKPICRASHCHS